MRLAYLSHSYVPSRRADAVQVMKMCEAWAALGHEVVLATKGSPPRQEPGVSDDFAFYGVKPRFEIRKLPRPAWRGGGLIFSYSLGRLIRREAEATDLFFCRDVTAARQAAKQARPFAFEAHVPPQNPGLCRVQRQFLAADSCLGLVVISQTLGDFYRSTALVPGDKPVVLAPDGASPAPAADPARSPLVGYQSPRIGYVGQLYPGKGLETVVQLAAALPEGSFHVVGGEEISIRALRARSLPPNLHLHGFIEPSLLADYYAGFDIVVMPYGHRVSGASAQTDLSRWMSPMKMFEYMAAGKAIVSADLPVLREVLRHEQNALLVPPEDVAGWTDAVRRLAGDAALRVELGTNARRDLEERYTWASRARLILHELEIDAA